MHIMTVDDSLVMRHMLSDIIQTLGYDSVQANNGQQALEVMQDPDKSGNIGLILLDWNMPVMNGYDFLVALRNELHSETPVIMVTTESEKTNIIKAIQAGANHYLIKPFSPEELSLRIMQALS